MIGQVICVGGVISFFLSFLLFLLNVGRFRGVFLGSSLRIWTLLVLSFFLGLEFLLSTAGMCSTVKQYESMRKAVSMTMILWLSGVIH